MSNSKHIIDALLKEDLYTAKKLINEDLVSRMGDALETKLVEFGPTIFSEGLKGNQKKIDANKNGKIDGEDFKLLKKKKMTNEEVDSLAEDFENQLKSLVEEIETETGEELSEEEIGQLAHDLLDILSEEQEEDEEEDEEEEEEKKAPAPAAKKGFNPRNTGGDAY